MKKKAKRALRALQAGFAGRFDTLRGAAAGYLLGQSAGRETLFVFYDLKSNPISYDVMWNLCLAECERLKQGLQNLHVVFVGADTWEDGTEQNPAYRAVIDGEARRWLFQNVLVPACDLVPSVAGYSFCRDRSLAGLWARLAGRRRFPDDYSAAVPMPFTAKAELIKAAEDGLPVQALRANEQGLRHVRRWLEAHAGGKKTVAITLRQYGFGEARNSNLQAWGRFGRKLIDDGYFPIIVPDTYKAMQPVPPELVGLPFFPHASLHLGLRAALYELVWMNMATSGGPAAGLCLLQPETRLLMLKVVVESEKLASTRHLKKIGTPADTDLPFLTPFQRVLWRTDDDYDSIVREFDKLADEIERFETADLKIAD